MIDCKVIISIILGLSISLLFWQVCKKRNCIIIQGPYKSIEDKTFREGNKCFRYKTVDTDCKCHK